MWKKKKDEKENVKSMARVCVLVVLRTGLVTGKDAFFNGRRQGMKESENEAGWA